MKTACSINCQSCPAWSSSLFAELSNGELEELQKNKTQKIILKNEAVFRQGESITGLYCISSGGLKVMQKTSQGESLVRLAPPSDTVGHRSLFLDHSYKGSALAIFESSVCFISTEVILNLLKINPKFSLRLIKKMAHDMSFAEKQNISNKSKNVRERLAEFIIYYVSCFQSDNQNDADLRLTRHEIATIVGAAEDTIIRLFSEFKEEGWISESGKTLTILNHQQLSILSGLT